MARCDEIALLLGSFEDGELEPHEMQEVARHVVACAACEAALAGYRALGLVLRDTAVIPPLAGFSAAVVARLEQIKVPFHVRLRQRLGETGERIFAALMMGGAAAAVATVTAVFLAPYAHQFAIAHSTTQLAAAAHAPAATSGTVAQTTMGTATATLAAASVNHPDNVADNVTLAASGTPGITPLGSDSEAIISRLESDSPSVAVWSEPRTDTTVIWVPDRP